MWRSQKGAEFLRYDFNNDLIVTRDEILKYAAGDPSYRESMADRFMEDFDSNRDGKVTISEAISLKNPNQSHVLRNFLAADKNADGKVTTEELVQFLQKVFDHYDLNHDGELSREEINLPFRARQMKREMQLERDRKRELGCSVPIPTSGAKVVGFGAYRSWAVSTSYVGSPDEVTTVIDVNIEVGKQPLYLFFTSQKSIIWRFTGNVERIEQIVASSQHSIDEKGPKGAALKSSVGLIGVPKSKVSITSRSCLRIDGHEDDPKGRNKKQASEEIASITDRNADAWFGEYGPRSISLPSGKFAYDKEGKKPRPEGFDETLWQEALTSYRGGLVQIDPKQIVADEPVHLYSVLPAEMGLAQLVGQGAIRVLPDRRYLVVRDIARVPPDMFSVYSSVFVLADGVKLPPGDLKHSCWLTVAEAEKTKGLSCDELRPPPPPVPKSPSPREAPPRSPQNPF